MNKIKLKYLKIKWLKQFKKLIKAQSNDYYEKTLSNLYNFDTKTSLFSISFFDTVNNKELNKLIKKLYKLKKNKRINEKRFYKLKYKNKIKCYSSPKGTLLDYKLLNGIKNVYSENIDFITNIISV